MADLEGRLSPPSCIEDLEDEALDPRIQVELERLNKASEEINKLELELDDARAGFRQALSDSTQKLNTLAKKLGSCVEKARPYYDARMKTKEAHIETQKAALRYERACSMHEAAKEMVQLAEQGYMCREEPSDPAWQEMLNHATMKVNEAEKERNESEQEHMRTTLNFNEADTKVQYLQRELKRAIAKSKPYFEMKAKFNQTMEDQKRGIHMLEEDVTSAKTMYSEALRNLELISDDIHQKRQEKRKQMELGVRGAGVGSESPSPPPTRDKGLSLVEGQGSFHTSSCQGGLTGTTSSHAKDSVFTSKILDDGSEFLLPSVIHASPEMARTLSYREAIENRLEQPEMDEFPVSRMEDEYKSLPISHSPRVPLNTGKRDSIVGEVSNSVYSSSPSGVGQFQRRESRESTPSSGSPTGSRRKLQGGLILKIDAAMDPLTQTYQAQEIQPTRRLRPHRGKDTMSKQKSLEFSKHNPFGSPNGSESVRKSAPVVMNSPGRQANLLVPGSSQDADDGSDTESIASTGPMLDDDQVELLTLEFSDQASMEESSPTMRRQEWNRFSLPPKLSHLEQYITQKSLEKDEQTPESPDKTLEQVEPDIA